MRQGRDYGTAPSRALTASRLRRTVTLPHLSLSKGGPIMSTRSRKSSLVTWKVTMGPDGEHLWAGLDYLGT